MDLQTKWQQQSIKFRVKSEWERGAEWCLKFIKYSDGTSYWSVWYIAVDQTCIRLHLPKEFLLLNFMDGRNVCSNEGHFLTNLIIHLMLWQRMMMFLWFAQQRIYISLDFRSNVSLIGLWLMFSTKSVINMTI